MVTAAHGAIQTPAFMPVGTRGAVKGITHRDVEDAGAEIILGNTATLAAAGRSAYRAPGGLHRFMGWTARS